MPYDTLRFEAGQQADPGYLRRMIKIQYCNS